MPQAIQGSDRCLVTIRRDDPRDARRPRVFVRIDGGANHTFTLGHSVTVELAPGSHLLVAQDGPYKKRLQFALTPGEHLRFTLTSRAPVAFLARVRWIPGAVSISRHR